MLKRLSKIQKFGLILVLGVAMTFAACTDVTDNVTDQVTSDNFFQTPQEFISAMGDVYGSLTAFGGDSGLKILMRFLPMREYSPSADKIGLTAEFGCVSIATPGDTMNPI